MTEQTAAVVETPAPQTETEAMAAVWDKLAAQGVEDEPQQEEAENGLQQEEKAEGLTDAPESAPEEAKAPEQASEEKPEAPTDLPASIRAKWKDMPEDARDAVLSSHRDLNRRLAESGRVVQVAKPVFDVLVQAAKEIPTLADMTPAQIAQDVFQMAKIQGHLAQDPVGTLLGIAKQYGAVDGIKAAIVGQGQSGSDNDKIELMREIRSLKQQLQGVADPAAIEQRVTQTLTVRETERMVAEYAAQKPHWGEVEGIMPQFIAMAQQSGKHTSAMDVLDAAYDMAIHAIPDLRAKVAAAAQNAPNATDPARTAAQLKAKSVNVTSTSTGKPRPQTEQERLAAIWDKYHN